MTGGRGSRTALAVVATTILAFAIAGALRLNVACLFEPDSPDYLVTSRALATFEGYREIDHPDRPLHAFRPPGLPALLVPVSRARPYDVVAAKAVVLATALGFLVVLAGYTRRVAGAWPAAAVVALTAASPSALLHATEVVTEPPFLLASTAVLWLAASDPRLLRRGGMPAAALLLALLPFLRTIGVTLVAACLVWGLASRERRRWALAAGFAVVPTLLWSWRNVAAGGPTYLASIATSARAGGLRGTLERVAETAGFYVSGLADLALAGLGRGPSLHDRLLVEPAPVLGLPATVVTVAGVALLAAAAAGAWRRRAELAPAALYVAATAAALALYPPRHERLAWPLVPVLWVGCAALVARRAGPGRTHRRTLVAVAIVAAVAWQGVAFTRIVATNVAWRADPSAFHRGEGPPSYFADWAGAGALLAAAAAPHERVLTRHSDLGFTSRRYQDSIRFEEVGPHVWRARLVELGARFIAVPTTECGAAFRWHELAGDPVFAWREVGEADGVAVFEAHPNRAGAAGVDGFRPRLIERCRDLVEAHPGRVAPRRRLAELLAGVGRGEEALAVLADAARAADAGLLVSRSRVLLALDRPDEALAAARAAAGASGATRLGATIDRVRRAAEEAVVVDASPAPERARGLAAEAQRRLAMLDVDTAGRLIERAEAAAPGEPRVRAARARWYERRGRRDEARALVTDLAAAGDVDAAAWLAREAAWDAAGAGRLDRDATLRLAADLAGRGQPGRALALLERAAAAAPGDPAIEARLGDAWTFYGRPDLAAAAFARALAARPGDPAPGAGAARAADRLRPAAY